MKLYDPKTFPYIYCTTNYIKNKKKQRQDIWSPKSDPPKKREEPTGILDVLSAILDISAGSTEREK